MEKLKATIESVLSAIAEKRLPSDEDPREWLKKILTKKEMAHIKFNYLRNGMLGLLVDSSTWHYNLNLKKAQLVDKLRQLSPSVKEIRFKIGEVK